MECLKLLLVVAVPYPCDPSPCGPNSQCKDINHYAVCSCLSGYIGSPPTCRPECVTSSECPLNQACTNQKCINPCLGTCGIAADCQVINHNPVCTCRPKYTGDPFVACFVIRKIVNIFYEDPNNDINFQRKHLIKNL